ARLGASRYRAGVLGTVVPSALPPWAGCVSRPLPRPPGRGGLWQPGWYPRAWRWSVAGRPGPAPRSPAPQHGAGGDGPQRTFCGRRGSVPCGPRLSLGVRPITEEDVAIKIVILGAGALGSILGGHLARAGEEVTIIARGQRAAYIQQHGITLTGLADFTMPVAVTTQPQTVHEADVLVVAVKTYDTEPAL